MWKKLTFVIDCLAKARLWFLPHLINASLHTSALTRSHTHQGNLFVIFLAVGSDFQTRWVVSAAPSASYWAPHRFFQQHKKLSEKHFTLRIGALCPCEKDFKEVILFYFFFSNSCTIDYWGDLKPRRAKNCRFKLSCVIARVNAPTRGLGVTARHVPNDNLGFVVELC